jgi:excinuclease UvrABC ATPase subunit
MSSISDRTVATPGGEVVVAGTPEDVARCRASHTGRFLKARLK